MTLSFFGEKLTPHGGLVFSRADLVPLDMKWAKTCAGDGDVSSSVEMCRWIAVCCVAECVCVCFGTEEKGRVVVMVW